MNKLTVAILVVLVAVASAIGGGATATVLITGKQIKNNSVTGKDIKDGSLAVGDLDPAQAAQLHGANGTPGTNGKNGADASGPPISGHLYIGGGMLYEGDSAGNAFQGAYTVLPFTQQSPAFTVNTLNFGDTQGLPPAAGEQDLVKCAGDAIAPAPQAGQLCVYVSASNNVLASTMQLYPGATVGADLADGSGFQLSAKVSSGGSVLVQYIWAYQAP